MIPPPGLLNRLFFRIEGLCVKNPAVFKIRPIMLLLALAVFFWGTAGALGSPRAWAGPTLEKVQSRKLVACGVTEPLAGFSYKDNQGRWQGFMVDFCRAVAAAALGDGERASFTPLSSPGRFPALLSGQIDLLAHTTTWTFGRRPPSAFSSRVFTSSTGRLF